MRSLLILAAAIAALPDHAVAQGSRIADEGSFTITVNGRTAGRENFRITATTRGDVTEYSARADVTYGDRKLSPELRTDAQGGIVEYTVSSRSGGSTDKWQGTVTRGRLTATITSGSGTAAREYIVPAGSVLLDSDIIHQHWFLALRSRDGALALLVPRQGNIQTQGSMSTVGQETLQIGNHDVATTHLRASISGDVHDVWVDKSGRLVKVAIPSRGLVAVRDDPPPA